MTRYLVAVKRGLLSGGYVISDPGGAELYRFGHHRLTAQDGSEVARLRHHPGLHLRAEILRDGQEGGEVHELTHQEKQAAGLPAGLSVAGTVGGAPLEFVGDVIFGGGYSMRLAGRPAARVQQQTNVMGRLTAGFEITTETGQDDVLLIMAAIAGRWIAFSRQPNV
jgi:hypothetical protein